MKAVEAYESGPERNVEWLHAMVPEPWRKLANPYPTTDVGLKRGHRIYQSFCIGCHGPIGDGMGPAQPYLYPPPLNFTILRDRGITGGILYYQIMNGITGTAMPYFKRELESEKIWDVGNYVAVTFIGQSDAHGEPRGIDAAYLGPVRERNDMSGYYLPWVLLIVVSLWVSLAGFFWALRHGQFSEQERARYLPLRDELSATPTQKRCNEMAGDSGPHSGAGDRGPGDGRSNRPAVCAPGREITCAFSRSSTSSTWYSPFSWA